MNELVLSLVTAAFAWWCAMDDAEAIAAGKKIRHGLQWCLRAAWVLIWCALFDAWLLALPLAFLFSGVFRLCLNRLRGLDVRHVSPSNWYDWMFIRSVYKEREFSLTEFHRMLYKRDKPRGYVSIYTDAVHRAGTIAYVFEAVAYGVGLWYV